MQRRDFVARMSLLIAALPFVRLLRKPCPSCGGFAQTNAELNQIPDAYDFVVGKQYAEYTMYYGCTRCGRHYKKRRVFVSPSGYIVGSAPEE